MARELPLSVRLAFNSEVADDVIVSLVTITHPALPGPILLSSDPTERISVNPLRYGTRSNGLTYDFVLMGVSLPDDRMGSPAAVTLTFENVAADMAKIVRAAVTPATINIKCVLTSAPNVIEEEWSNLIGVQATYDASRITFEISRQAISNEPWPAHRMTQQRFPRLFV